MSARPHQREAKAGKLKARYRLSQDDPRPHDRERRRKSGHGGDHDQKPVANRHQEDRGRRDVERTGAHCQPTGLTPEEERLGPVEPVLHLCRRPPTPLRLPACQPGP